MAEYDRETFVRNVLIELGVIAADEAPSAEDAEYIGKRTQQVFEGLYDEGLIPFDLDGDIPARYFLPLVQMVAAQAQLAYGVQSRAQLLLANAAGARKELWKLRQRPYVDVPTKATYF